MNRASAWYKFAYRVWNALFLGWAAVLVGLTPVLRLDRAGALLVCGAIVAEVFHDKGYRKFIESAKQGLLNQYSYIERPAQHEDRLDIEIIRPNPPRAGGGTRINTVPWVLYQLANPKEFYPHEDTRLWNLEGTLSRVERRVDWAIVISAVTGTVLWAFG